VKNAKLMLVTNHKSLSSTHAYRDTMDGVIGKAWSGKISYEGKKKKSLTVSKVIKTGKC